MIYVKQLDNLEQKLVVLESSDLTEVIALENICFEDPWTKNNFEAEFQSAFSWALGITINNSLVAQCFFWLVSTESHLLKLAVNPNHRKKGLAKSLIEALIFFSQKAGATNILLEVNHKNIAANSLYKKLGFKTIGKRPLYYNNQDDAIIMQLKV